MICFQVTPVILVSDLKDSLVSVRKCLYPYEMEVLPSTSSLAEFDKQISRRSKGVRMQRLANFSQHGCFYECMLEGASVASFCTPWLFPPHKDNSKQSIAQSILVSKCRLRMSKAQFVASPSIKSFPNFRHSSLNCKSYH